MPLEAGFAASKGFSRVKKEFAARVIRASLKYLYKD